VVRELSLKNVNLDQLLLIKLTRASRYKPYFLSRQEKECKNLWLAAIDQNYDGSWETLVIQEEEFMEFFDVKICYSFWKNDAGCFWDLEALRAYFDEEYEQYLDYAMR
jgi:hypothetical protein